MGWGNFSDADLEIMELKTTSDSTRSEVKQERERRNQLKTEKHESEQKKILEGVEKDRVAKEEKLRNWRENQGWSKDQFEYPNRDFATGQPVAKPAVRRTDGTTIAPGEVAEVIARTKYLENIDLSNQKIQGRLVAFDRVLRGADMRGAKIFDIQARGWDLQGANLGSMTVEKSNCADRNLTGAKVSGLRFVGCNIDGLVAPSLQKSQLIDCTGYPKKLAKEKDEEEED